jgi:5-carboxymethyl-2-hydroxymuconic-semialdehyde dehydrogenase
LTQSLIHESQTGPARLPGSVPELISHYIDGKLVPSLGGEKFDVIDPATNSCYTACASGQAQDVHRAVAAARRAFLDGAWSELTAGARARVLNRIADEIEQRDDELAAMESFDTGLPITQARGQAQRAAENFRFFAALIAGLNDDAFHVGGQQLNYSLRRPLGVAGLITPWNTPFMLETWKLAPALAAGCSVVLKPAEWSPLSASLLPPIMEAAGLPAGVFNIVQGIGEIAGASLVDHPDVPVISFTGETTTGQIIARNAAANLKKLSMELGGKSPFVIFADADIEAALRAAAFQVFSLNGERCTAGSRLLVERPIYDQVVEAMARRARNVRLGPPGDPQTQLGALIHPDHYHRVMSYIEKGTIEGARLVAGGQGHLAEGGTYIDATVFADVMPNHSIFQEEIFGPVLSITPFDTEAEALTLSNATTYGLAAYVWTRDLRRAHEFAGGIEAGMSWINSQNVRDLRTPFGGIKRSGLGQEGGTSSIDVFSETRVIHVALQVLPVPDFGGIPRSD